MQMRTSVDMYSKKNSSTAESLTQQ